MRHPNLLDSRRALLLIVDVQESFTKILPDSEFLIGNVKTLAKAAKILQLPIFVTEQYPKGLGKTLTEIVNCLGEHQVFAKTSFSCAGAQNFMNQLQLAGRTQIIVCGIEAHVCVSQTVHDLLQTDYQIHVIADAISSRIPENKKVGLKKMEKAGAIISSVETALFEMLGGSEVESFKAVQQLVK